MSLLRAAAALVQKSRQTSKNERFVIVEGSQSSHCCFEFTVVDTTKREEYGDGFETVCETFGIDEAEMVCKALNRG